MLLGLPVLLGSVKSAIAAIADISKVPRGGIRGVGSTEKTFGRLRLKARREDE